MPPMSEHDTWNMFAAAALSNPTINVNGVYPHRVAASLADALLAESKKREAENVPAVATETKPRPMALPDDDGWLLHNGYGPPCSGDAFIELVDGSVLPADHINWQHRFRYRIVSEAGVTK